MSAPGSTPTIDGQVPAIVDVICFSTADWDAPVWTNKQQLMSRLAERGIRIVYVDSPGHRTPLPSKQDAARVAQRLRAWRPLARPIGTNLWRDSPLLIPGMGGAMQLNRTLLQARARRNALLLGMRRPVIWTYSPIAARVYDSRRHSALVYHCVDDLAAFPGVNGPRFRAEEQLLVQSASICIGSSRHLVEHLHRLGAVEVVYWPNAADSEGFSAAANAAAQTRTQGSRARIGFLGAVQEDKIDLELLQYCANALPDCDFVLAGPIGLGLGHSSLRSEVFPPNVTFPGLVERSAAPAMVATFDVGIIPYRLTPYTRGVFPMKVFEYLAAGVPVVSTALPSLVDGVSEVNIGRTPQEFVLEIRNALETAYDTDRRHARMNYAALHSWVHRTDEAEALLRSLVP